VTLQPVLRQRGAAHLHGVKVFAGVFPQRLGHSPDHAVATKQELGGRPPSRGLEQGFVVPKVVDGLAEHVGAELHRDVPEPAHAPLVIAAQALVKVKSHTFVLGLFGRVPAPEGFEGFFGPSKPVAWFVDALQGQITKNRGVVLKSGGDGQLVQITFVAFAEKFVTPFFQAPLGTGAPVVDQALFFKVCVVQGMQVTVRGFLAHKPFGNLLELGVFWGVWKLLGACLDRVNERLLSHRKAHRQSVGIGR